MSALTVFQTMAAYVHVAICKVFGVSFNYTARDGTGYSTLYGLNLGSKGVREDIFDASGMATTQVFELARQLDANAVQFPTSFGPQTEEVLTFSGAAWVVKEITLDTTGAIYQLKAVKNEVHNIGARNNVEKRT